MHSRPPAILKIFGILWGSLVVLTIFLSILGIFLTAPSFYQGWLKFADIFSPFDVWNYIITVILLSVLISPAVGACAIYARLKKKPDMPRDHSETGGLRDKNPFFSNAFRKISAFCNNHVTELRKREVIREIISDTAGCATMRKQIYTEKTQKRTTLSREGKRMKLRASYKKDVKGFITATIEVIDPGDFPTVNVFKSESGNPSDEDWNPGEGEESTTSKTLPNSGSAKEWVLSQVNALEKKLDKWRDIVVPEPEEFDV